MLVTWEARGVSGRALLRGKPVKSIPDDMAMADVRELMLERIQEDIDESVAAGTLPVGTCLTLSIKVNGISLPPITVTTSRPAKPNS